MTDTLSPPDALRFLAQASHTLSSSLEYETTLRTVARLCVPTLADWCTVDLATEDGRLRRLAVTHVDPERERLGWEVGRRYPTDPALESGTYQVLRTGQPVMVSEITDEMLVQGARDAEHLALLRELSVTSYLGVPLRARGRTLGVLSLVAAESGRRYDANDLALAEDLAGRAALAVDNARLFTAEQVSRDGAERAADRLERLLSVAGALASAVSPVDVATTIVDHGVTAMGARAGGLYLFNIDDESLELVRAKGFPPAITDSYRRLTLTLPVPITDAARMREAIFIETRAERDRRYPAIREATRLTGSGALVALPLCAGARLFGTLGLSFAEEREFGPDDRRFLLMLAAQCAQALDRASLYDAERAARGRAEMVATDLAAAEERLRLAQKAARIGSWEYAPKAGVGVWSPELYALFGIDPGSELPTYEEWLQLVHPDDRDAADRMVRGAVADGRDLRADYRIVHATLGERWIHTTGRTYLDVDGTVARMIGITQDVTERYLAERAVRESEARFRSVYEANMLGIGFWEDGRIIDANDALLSLLGYTREDLSAGLLAHGRLTPPEWASADRRATEESLERGSCAPYEKEFYRQDGSRVPVIAGGTIFPDGSAVFYVLDQTERRQAEAQVQAAQRMDAVGRLAGGVAHEINNALQGVIGFGSFVLRSLPETDPRRRDVEEINRAGTRAAQIAQQLLAVGRRQLRQPVDLDLNQLVQEFSAMLRQALGPERKLRVSLAEHPALVHADRGQLEQVLLNLTLNGRDAMPPGGSLTVALREVQLPSDGAAGHARELPAGRYVRLEVRDSGAGMDATTLARVFEPFFTTKAPGQGTGLGLSVVYGIVRQSGGRIVVESAPGKGSVFSTYLPSVVRAPAPAAEPAPMPSGGRETILLVDDEPVVLMVAGRTLRDAGYEVLEAGNGRIALELLEEVRKKGRGVSIVVTDVIMPELDGRGLGERIAARQEAIPILYVSGHTTEGAIREGLPGRVTGFLNKPFDPDALLRAVRALLDRAVSRRTAPRS